MDAAHAQAFLAELLASRGYIVATVPSQARIDGPMQSEEDLPRHVEALQLRVFHRKVAGGASHGLARPSDRSLLAHADARREKS